MASISSLYVKLSVPFSISGKKSLIFLLSENLLDLCLRVSSGNKGIHFLQFGRFPFISESIDPNYEPLKSFNCLTVPILILILIWVKIFNTQNKSLTRKKVWPTHTHFCIYRREAGMFIVLRKLSSCAFDTNVHFYNHYTFPKNTS